MVGAFSDMLIARGGTISLGKVKVNGEVIKECDLISKTDVQKRNYIDNINDARQEATLKAKAALVKLPASS